MGLAVRLTPRAAADLEDIQHYLAARSKTGAENVRRRIEESINTLADFPGIGRTTDEPGVFMLPVVHYPYLVYYMVLRGELVIVHVRHASRDAPEGGERQERDL
jgi:plasmid stabilization system protein ParE